MIEYFQAINKALGTDLRKLDLEEELECKHELSDEYEPGLRPLCGDCGYDLTWELEAREADRFEFNYED